MGWPGPWFRLFSDFLTLEPAPGLENSGDLGQGIVSSIFRMSRLPICGYV